MTHVFEGQNEEVRKLQLTGGSTYIISIPKRWVISNNLKKGSSLKIGEEEDGTLTISPPELRKSTKSFEAFIKVLPKEEPGAIIRKIVAAYLVGYTLIHIKANNDIISSRFRNTLKTFARHLFIGTEIVTDTSTELTLQVLLSYPELSILSALRRMSIITCSMHKDAITAFKRLDHQIAKDVIATDNEVDRFHLYIIRQLKMAMQNNRIIREIGLTNARECLGYRLITKTVERTADHAVNIASNLLPLRKTVDQKVIQKIEQMSGLAISSFDAATESLFKKDYNLAEHVIVKTKEINSLEKEAVLSLKEAEMEEISSIRLLIESVRRTAEYASDIAEIVLNLTVESIIG